MTPPQPSLYDLAFDQLQARLTEWGQPAFRARQIWDWLYVRLADRYDAMTNLPRALRDRLGAEYLIGRLMPKVDLLSSDGWTRKILFALPDGAQIETVLMDYETRETVCVSTQAGCAMGCTFCATGQGGFQRNLTSGEIVEQVLFFERELRQRESVTEGQSDSETARSHTKPDSRSPIPDPQSTNHRLTNLVLMGMGEPFANYNALMDALRRLSDPTGFNFGARRITVSTVGLVPMIERFAQEQSQVNLAVSLHAATNVLRSSMLPINKRYPIEVLMATCRAYTASTHRRVSFEWALIENVNDTPEQARALAQLIRGMLCHVNLIPLNPTHGYAGSASTRERIAAFSAILDAAHIPNSLRIRRGIDIHAGCGQLKQAHANE
ncbi:MAG: 23S rRNA (adenine(2503)-C(2))-methyltransferase RlmN [Chloroflexi bacterium]|nr:23S rRNA (adenine(2503)-C(2))-methyltransferase RlmN [Chloroflexota bacterium]